MSYTKRQIITEAFAEIGLGPYQYDRRPEDDQTALRRLNALAAEWSAAGVDLGFPSNNTPGTDDLDADSQVPPHLVRGLICALAVDLCPGYGKAPNPATVRAAATAKDLALSQSVEVPSAVMDRQSVPAGAGHKYTNQIALPETAQTEKKP